MSIKPGSFFSKPTFNEPLLALSDARWQKLEGGYRGTPYNASVALQRLAQVTTIKEVDTIYQELWDELHHQGDIGLASYYAVPHLVRIAQERNLIDYNVLSLVSLIEVQRHKDGQPALPSLLEPNYLKALNDLGKLAVVAMQQSWNADLATAALAAIAVSKQQSKLADAILNLVDEGTLDEFLENYG